MAWQIAAAHPQEQYVPRSSYVTLAMAAPRQGLVTWRVLSEFEERAGPSRGDAWHSRRLVVRLYDVTKVEFNGFNANRILDLALDRALGERIFSLPTAGSVQLAEVGFWLHTGEFVPAARSEPVYFPSGGGAAEHDPSALFVDRQLCPEPVSTPWEAPKWLKRRNAPKLRVPLRLAWFSFESSAVGDQGASAAFTGELARELAASGHEVHAFLPRKPALGESRLIDGVTYHPVELGSASDPLELSRIFGQVAAGRVKALGHFDLYHWHEWMASSVLPTGRSRILCSLTSTERVRLGSGPTSPLSERIENAERSVACRADCVLVPEWLHARAMTELGVSEDKLSCFAFEGRFLDEWECPLDVGHVKMEMGFGPLDRVFLFMGPLEWGAGVDLLIEAMPALLNRYHGCRLAMVGYGGMQGGLEHRSHELGVAHAVRWLGHMEGHPLVRLLRAAEAVVLPSRQREGFDEGVVALARRAGRPVITTHQGPTHLVSHEQNGLVTYDNPGSMVWAMSQVLADSGLSEVLGALGRPSDDRRPQWVEVANHYNELCATRFSELCEIGPARPSHAPLSEAAPSNRP
jgi:glycosyltransferase involved in cell wall biosynthesis